MSTESRVKNAGTFLLLLFGFTIFIAKAPINIASGLLLIATLVYLCRFAAKEVFLSNRYVLILLFPLLVGFVLSFFSMAGWLKGPCSFLLRYRFLFLVLPFVLFVTRRQTLVLLFVLLNVAAFMDVAYCIVSADTSDLFNNMYGYHKFGRNSDMLFTLCLFNVNLIVGGLSLKQFRKFPGRSLLLLINTLVLLTGVVLLGERGAWLGMYCGLVVFLAVYGRKLLLGMVVLSLFSPLFLPQVALDRLNDIYSNDVRLKLFRVSVDFIIEENCLFLGTGAKNVQENFDRFVKTRSQDYQDDYHHIFEVYPGNLHSSFLQMAVEVGLVFVLAYLGAVLWIVIRLLRTMTRMNPPDRVIVMSVVSVTAGFLVSQAFHEELFRYGGLVFSLLLYSACFIETGYRHRSETALNAAGGPVRPA